MTEKRTTTIENVVITSVRLGYDHGFLSPWIMVEGGCNCGIGGYVCDKKYSDDRHKEHGWEVGSLTGFWVMRVIDTVEAETWEGLKGMHCRVEAEGIGGVIVAIGHWFEDKWFRPREELTAELNLRLSALGKVKT